MNSCGIVVKKTVGGPAYTARQSAETHDTPEIPSDCPGAGSLPIQMINPAHTAYQMTIDRAEMCADYKNYPIGRLIQG